jgi:hypothetical protein
MDKICTITEITGAGWDSDTIGYFETMNDALTAMIKQMEKKGMKYNRRKSIKRPGVIIINVTAPYYLSYEFKMETMDKVEI